MRRIYGKRTLWVCGSVALLWLALCTTVAVQQPPASTAVDHVILVSIDGLMPAYYLDPDRYGLKIPTLRNLMRTGVTFAGAEGVFPTVTYPSHTSIITGTSPAEHGIDSNTPFDPFNRTNGGWYWYSEDLKVPTLWDVARQAGKTTASVFWPVTVGAKLDINYPEYRTLASDDDVKLLRVLATPGLIEGIEARHGRIPGQRPDDAVRAKAAAYIIERHRPNLLLVHLTDLDGAQHRSGPGSPEAISTLEQIDGHLSSISQALGQAGMLERTAWVVVSDHGFRSVSRQFHPRVVLREEGYLTYGAKGELTDWRVDARIAGGTFALVARDPADKEVVERATRKFRALAADTRSGLARLYSPAEIRDNGGFPGAFLAGEAADEFMIGSATTGDVVTDSTSKGMHGYHPLRPDQLSALLLSGAGVRSGQREDRARLIDVAPTVARLLGVPMPTARGRVLNQALRD